jgi:hypothetical protein
LLVGSWFHKGFVSNPHSGDIGILAADTIGLESFDAKNSSNRRFLFTARGSASGLKDDG